MVAVRNPAPRASRSSRDRVGDALRRARRRDRRRGATASPWDFDPRPPYVASLVYLALFGSVAAFGAYLALMRTIGQGHASYVGVTTPVLALVLSTLFEGYSLDRCSPWPASRSRSSAT